MSDSAQGGHERDSILDKVENRHSVAHGREQVGAIWAEDQIAPAVDSSEEVGELDARLVTMGYEEVTVEDANLEIRLHFQSTAMFLKSVRIEISQTSANLSSYLWGLSYRRVIAVPGGWRDPC